MWSEISYGVLLIATSFLTALAALYVVALRQGASRREARVIADMASEDTVFLFDGRHLVDATPKARGLLALGPQGVSDWNRLSALLTPRFPGFSTEMERLAETGIALLEGANGKEAVRAWWLGGIARIAVLDAPPGPDNAITDHQTLSALNSELAILRKVAAHMPALTWQQDTEGKVTWANRAYLKLVGESRPEEDDLTWPLPRLFDTTRPTGMSDDLAPRRISITVPGGEVQWFDCIAIRQNDSAMFFALPADATVYAELSLRNFVQTLSKTFADLPTGLAIFNRSRHLVMFNPALIDLCMLDPAFLAARPTLFSFLDQLREKQMIPEPKNYKSWRQKMTTLEEQAANGVFEENWTLPTGQTYRVTGRPHPDGAVAFLFEDISSEISLTRRFRAELEMSQAVIDSMDEAIAVFSPAGILAISNDAYTDLWHSNPSETLGEIGIHDAARLWREGAAPSGFWDQAQAFVGNPDEREELRAAVTMADGRAVSCRLTTIAGGATLVGFSVAAHLPGEARNPAQHGVAG
ncbi:MAG: PAS-domain containing protein [Pseudomonadota bacterium]|nr:PAS-domain containing protein [Pseudomonadota bacterium]